MNFTLRQWGGIFTAISAAVLATVYISQYFFNMPPCHLCLIERWPYYAALLLSLLILCTHKKTELVLLMLLTVTFAISFGLGLFHFGVEKAWWTYASNCTATNLFQPGASVQDMMAALKNAPVVRCDQAIPFLFGISMAFYNSLASFCFALLAGYALNHNANSE